MVDAALGATITVDAILDGMSEITIPPGTQPGSVIMLRGHGMRELKSRRSRDVPEVRSTHSAGGGLFSRLRETFTGR